MFLFIMGCQTTPTRFDQAQEGYWRTKILVNDKKKNQSFIIHAEINAYKEKQLRLDITTPLGSHLASLVLNETEAQLLLVPQKKFYKGKVHAKVLASLISAPIDPRWFYNLLFDYPIKEKNWDCDFNNENFLSSCHNESENINIIWKDRTQNKKRLQIDHPWAHIQINCYFYSPSVRDPNQIFQLKAPKGFVVRHF